MSRPVLAIDGPSGAGKGTVCQLVAQELGWSLLDSGALYRILGLAAIRAGIDLDNGDSLGQLVHKLSISFEPGSSDELQVLLAGENVTREIRTETAGDSASQVAVHPKVREALLLLQQNYAQGCGLVADGRDMGTVVFPHAPLKIFLTASAEERANRRYKQLKDKGEDVNVSRLLEEIKARDERDAARSASPLIPADDAIQIDSTAMSIEQVTQAVLAEAKNRGLA
ncbi:MAG: cytidylate kinase [Pseudomonadales bacterium]